jgi:hypothetical protein
MLGAVNLGIADNGECAGHEQAAQIDSAHIFGTLVPVEEPSTASIADIQFPRSARL